jgi:hypothetical protein
VIVAVAAVEFSAEGLGREFYTRVDAESCEHVGLNLDASCVIWWLQQSEEARAEICLPGIPINQALLHLSTWLPPPVERPDGSGKKDGPEIWGNGASFDPVLLEGAYRACGLTIPFRPFSIRCYRTLKALFPLIAPPANDIAHNALADARAQAMHASEY